MRRILLICLAAAACGTIDGDDPFALWRVHEHPEQAFHFHYPAPPFGTAEGSSAAHPVLVVASGAGAGEPSWPRYRLEAWLTVHGDIAGAAAGESAGLEEQGFEVTPSAARWNRAGDEGLAIHGAGDEADAVVFLLRGSAGIVAIALAGTGEMDHPDVELLLDGFEPRGAEER